MRHPHRLRQPHRPRFRNMRKALLTAGAIVALIAGVLAGAATSQAAGSLPCDIYGAAGTPCVAAHSTVRALYSLVQRHALPGEARLRRRDARHRAPRGRRIRERGARRTRSARARPAPSPRSTTSRRSTTTSPSRAPAAPAARTSGANATALPVTVGGHTVVRRVHLGGHGLPGQRHLRGRDRRPAEGMYMVTAGTHVNGGCCFDYGNAETSTQRHRQRPHGRDQLRHRVLVRAVLRAPARGCRPTWRTVCSPAATAPTPPTPGNSSPS